MTAGFSHRRKGAISVLAALTFVMVAGMAAFAVDVGHILYARSKLVSAAENGAMAAVESLPDGAAAVAEAQHLARLNYDGETDVVTASDVVFGVWNRDTREFTPSSAEEANAVRVTARLSEETNNPLPLFLGHFLGRDWANVSGKSVVSRQVFAGDTPTSPGDPSVYVTSTKDLSNVVLEFADGSHQKFEGLGSIKTATFSGTGQYAGKDIVGVWIKSGQNGSGDGPGYGERIDNSFDGLEVHGHNQHQGPIPHVTATFDGGKTLVRAVL